VLERFRVEAIEVVSPKIPIFDWCLQNVEGNDEEVWAVAMVALFTPRRAATLPELCEKIVVLLGGDGPCSLAKATT